MDATAGSMAVSGFESAIRGAISRAPDGRPETRARIYAAARASLDRSLARLPDTPDGDTRREALELTIERIEREWVARSSRALSAARPASPPPSEAPSGPPLSTSPPERAAPVDPPAPRSAPLPEPTIARSGEVAPASGEGPPAVPAVRGEQPMEPGGETATGEAGASAPPADREPSVAMPPAAYPIAGEAAPGPIPEAPEATDASEPFDPPAPARDPGEGDAATDVAPLPNAAGAAATTRPEPSMPAEPVVSRPPERLPSPTVPHDATLDADDAGRGASPIDPALAAALAARDGVAPAAAPAIDARAPAAQDGAVAVDEPPTAADGALRSPEPVDTAPPPVEVDRRARPARKRRGRRADPDVGARTKRTPRGRRIARAASLLLVAGAGLLGYRWLDDAGMFEAGERTATPITTIERPPEVTADERPWTELMTRELAGAVEPLPGEDALRVNGRGEIALDASALAALGPEISVSLLVRAVGEPGQASVQCEFAGGGCGRVRFPLPREAEERVIAATIGEGGEARLVLDAAIGGAPAPFDLLGVTARAR